MIYKEWTSIQLTVLETDGSRIKGRQQVVIEGLLATSCLAEGTLAGVRATKQACQLRSLTLHKATDSVMEAPIIAMGAN